MVHPLETPWERLRWARQIAGISARELDRLAGLAEGHSSLLEAGKKKDMETRTATRIAEVLGLSLDWFVRGKGPLPTSSEIAAAYQAKLSEAAA